MPGIYRTQSSLSCWQDITIDQHIFEYCGRQQQFFDVSSVSKVTENLGTLSLQKDYCYCF